MVIQMKERIIVHADINHCYAQIEEMKNPSLKHVPMAVGGSEKNRHGIILAKNRLASKYKIKTGESLMMARQKCPDLKVVAPNYQDYITYSNQVKNIYREYSDQVESFGIDEAWIDLTGSTRLFGPGIEIARTIQRRVYSEVGLTISVGISWNKIFAKLGSDLEKPLGFVEITKENYKEVVWPCSVSDLLYVGKKTKEKLLKKNVHTIKDLAVIEPKKLKPLLGENGLMLWRFANGWDETEVKKTTHEEMIKSVGNGVTTPKDMKNIKEAELVLQTLSESVSSRLRQKQVLAKTVQISFRNTELKTVTRQKTLTHETDLSDELLRTALELLRENYDFILPLRSISISARNLYHYNEGINIQLNFFEERDDNRILDMTVDMIRQRFGHGSIKRCSALLDEDLSSFNPQSDHTIHPVSFFK